MSLKKSKATTLAIDRVFSKTRFDNSYAKLPEHFYARLNPIPVKNPALIKINQALADELGLESSELLPDLAAQIFSGNLIPAQAEPIAMAYAGHQFGNFVPQLGDGRAILLGEVLDRGGNRRDIHLKGSGQTPFSRNADGRSPLGPVIREYLVSEAMYALGISTTRSLAAVTTGETVYRETPLPGAVLTRVAKSHIRLGTFEYFSFRNDQAAIKQLADYVIARLYPEIQEAENPYLALLQSVSSRQAKLVASWMHLGFVHGVMNTDNMAISGETIDYGPCAFIDSYNPGAVFSSIDRFGRYAYNNQDSIALWNLARFAETLLPLFHENIEKAVEKAESVLSIFPAQYEDSWLEGMRKKLGLKDKNDADKDLTNSLLSLMHSQDADFTLTFRALCIAAETQEPRALQILMGNSSALNDWFAKWQLRSQQQNISPTEQAETMRAINPAYIPRNHQIEQAITLAIQHNNFSEMETLLNVFSKPYEESKQYEAYMLPPKPDERVIRTFCGT